MTAPRASLTLNPARMRFRRLIGTGGIGSGRFFRLEGNRTLGREESRAGWFLDRRDYCKLHIIAHYVQVLAGDGLRVAPIGRVGRDADGDRLLEVMRGTGMDLRFVGRDARHPTLSCICLLYPDGSGGNLTVNDSASAQVDVADIHAAERELAADGAGCLVLAVPEVPLSARATLLRLGKRHGAWCAASFVSGEMDAVRREGLLEAVDLLALNADEAAALADLPATLPADQLVETAGRAMMGRYPHLTLSLTAGAAGSWTLARRVHSYQPVLDGVEVQGAAGAGDAHLAGLLTGVVAGLSFEAAHALAALVASGSVTSPHTIHPALDRACLQALATRYAPTLPGEVAALLNASA